MSLRAFIVALLSVLALGAAPLAAQEYAEEATEEEAAAVQPQAPVLVPVPRVTIYPGDTVTADKLVERDFAAEGLPVPVAFSSRQAMVGKVAKQTLLPRLAVPLGAVREPYTVKQGQSAVVVFKSAGLTISATAVTLEGGSVGDMIALRNVESGTTIRGTVQGDGTVRVGTP